MASRQTAEPSSSFGRRPRGRPAALGPLTLLERVADVCAFAVAAGEVPHEHAVSMPMFNRVKVDADRARGITDPKSNSERTPTAEAIRARFTSIAGRPAAWSEILDGALRPAKGRDMWLAAFGREERRSDLTDEQVRHALRLVELPTLFVNE